MRSVVRAASLALLVCLLTPAAEAAAPAAPPAPAPAPSPAPVALTVRVEGPDGKPLAGARVAARGTAAKGATAPAALVEAVTGADGTATVRVPDACPCALRAEAPGLAPAALGDAGTAPTLRLGRGAVVEGQAFDVVTGKPLAGAEALALGPAATLLEDPADPERFAPKAKTGEDGRFRLEGVAPEDVVVLARKEGYRPARQRAALVEGANPAFPLYLAPGVPVSGRVLDPAGKPVGGAVVTAATRDLRPQIDAAELLVTRTKGDGTFVFRGLPPAASYVLVASHPAWANGTSPEVPAAAGRRPAPVTIALRKGATLRATLRDGEQPFAGKVSVQLLFDGGGPLDTRLVRRDEEVKAGGVLVVERLAEGTAKLTLTPAGYADLPARDVRLDAAAPADLGPIALERGRTIAGRVADAEGKPVAGAQVEALGLGVGGASRLSATSGADGAFVLGGVKEGFDYRVTVRNEGGATATREGVKEGTAGVDLVLAKPTKITGRAVAGDPPAPVPFVTVEAARAADGGGGGFSSLLSALEGGNRATSRAQDGRFTLGGVAPGTYAVTVSSPGFVPARLEKVEAGAGDGVDVGDVRLSRGATLRVSVVDKKTKTPLGGAGVAQAAGGMFGGMRDRMQRDAALLTGPDGTVALKGLPPGRVTVKVRREGYAPAKADVDIAADAAEADVTVALSEGGAVEGTVRDREGRLRPGAMVIVQSGVEANPDLLDQADEAGNYRIERVPPGSYMVIALGRVEDQVAQGGMSPEMMSQMQMLTATVEDEKTVRVDFPAGAGKVTVRGFVKRGGRPIAGRMFWVRDTEGGGIPSDFVTVTAGADGGYQVRLQAAGKYRVRVQDAAEDITSPGFGVTVEIPEKAEVEQDVVEPAGALTGQVFDVATARPLAGARVTALRLRGKDEVDTRDPVGAAGTSDQDGRVAVRGLAKGRYRVIVSIPGYGLMRFDDMESDGEKPTSLQAGLERAPALPVRVADAAGVPVQGAMVIAEDELFGAAFGRLEGLTDGTGAAQLRTCGRGTHTLLAIAPGFAPRRVADVQVGDEARAPVAIQLDRGGALRLRVTDNAGQPVSDAGVRLREENGPDISILAYFARIMGGKGFGLGTDAAGALDLEPLPPGALELEVVRRDEVLARKTVRIRSGETETLAIKLP